jgi:toxin ParE1/3/4
MTEPRLTDRARDDLRAIWFETANRRDEAAADRMTAKVLEACRAHARFPETGRSRDDLLPGLRSFPVAPFVVFFRPHADTIEVLRVLHGRRDVGPLLREDE